MERPIEGPEPYRPYIDSKAAGRWLGDIGPDLFESLMAQHLPTVRPVWLGKYKHWTWLDCAMLASILARAETLAPAAAAKRNRDVGEDEK